MNLCITFFICLVSVLGSYADLNYWEKREKFIEYEKSLELGSDIILTPEEERVNQILMKFKSQELNEGFIHPEKFPPARHFFEARDDIENSSVFSFISKMPKGGALHVHDKAISSSEYVVYNITYRDNLYVCINDDNNISSYRFSNSPPVEECYILMSELRARSKDVQKFDFELLETFTLFTANPNEKYPDINSVWTSFNSIFDNLSSLLKYVPVFLDYMQNALQEFYNDNVNYIEIRSSIPTLYEIDGTKYSPIQVLGLIYSVAQNFMKDHPNFLGVKYIYATFRGADNTTMDQDLTEFLEMQKLYPDFLIGFDLVGQEDRNNPLINNVDRLIAVSDKVKFFFHAAETNWNGLTDMNVIDALLLNTTRIGHGFGITKHPKVMLEIKKRGIAIEVNPISNQVLALVKDMRNHPASVLFSLNIPVVISSDDPGLWGAVGLSYDFYEAFMGIASSTADLRMLKQLALNSLKYSALEPKEKEIALLKFNRIWNEFINRTLKIF